jgi:hypothetical protein
MAKRVVALRPPGKRDEAPYRGRDNDADAFKAHIGYMQQLNRDLTASRELVGGEG